MSRCLIWMGFSSSVDVVDVKPAQWRRKWGHLTRHGDSKRPPGVGLNPATWWAGSLLWLYTLQPVELILNSRFSSSVIYCFVLFRKASTSFTNCSRAQTFQELEHFLDFFPLNSPSSEWFESHRGESGSPEDLLLEFLNFVLRNVQYVEAVGKKS